MKKLIIPLLFVLGTLNSCELIDLKRTTTLTLKNDESGCKLYYLVVEYPDGEVSDNLLSGSSLGYGSTKEIEVRGTGSYKFTVSKFEEGYAPTSLWQSVMGICPATKSFHLADGDEKEIVYTQEQRYVNSDGDFVVDEELDD